MPVSQGRLGHEQNKSLNTRETGVVKPWLCPSRGLGQVRETGMTPRPLGVVVKAPVGAATAGAPAGAGAVFNCCIFIVPYGSCASLFFVALFIEVKPACSRALKS